MKYIITSILAFLIITGCNQLEIPEPVISVFSKLTPFDVETLVPSIPTYFGKYEIPVDNPMTKEGIALGRMLFYEKMLSGDNTMSCSSCHIQEFAFTDQESKSIGIHGDKGKRNSMSIQNLLWERNFFWDGRAGSLEEQALMPIEDELELDQTLEEVVTKLKASNLYPVRFEQAFGDPEITSDRIAKAIAQFERTLVSSNSKYDKDLRIQANGGTTILTAEETAGKYLFERHNSTSGPGAACFECHSGSTFSDQDNLRNNGVDVIVVDKGLEDVTGNLNDRGKMKVPTLRNIAVTGPYMHDGRFESLKDVLNHYNDSSIVSHENIDQKIIEDHQGSPGNTLNLTSVQIEQLVAFLETLTDEEFLENPEFGNPF